MLIVAVISEEEVLESCTPINTHLEALPVGAVSTSVGVDVLLTFSAKAFLNVLAIGHPSAMLRAKASSTAVDVIAPVPLL